MVVNGVGGALTAVVMIVFAVTKFRDGAWLVVILIPALVTLFSSIHYHYRQVASQLSLGELQISPHESPIKTILLVDDVHAGTLRLVNFAQSLGHPWQALHVAVDPDRVERIRQNWMKRIGIGELKFLPSPYRSLTGPLREYIIQLRQADPEAFKHILVGQLALPNYATQGLHRNTNLFFDLVLRDIDRVVVTSVPYQIDQSDRYRARLQKELKET